MTYSGQQPQFGYPQQPPVTSPVAPSKTPRGRKPRPWHIAAAATLALLWVSIVLASLPPKCVAAPPAPPKPVQSESACISEYLREHPLGSNIDAKSVCKLRMAPDILDGLGTAQVCTPRATAAVGVTGWGAVAAAITTLVFGLRRRREFAEHRKNVSVTKDFINRVPEGFEDRVPPQVLADVAQRGQAAAQVVFMEREYLGALTGAAAIEKADVYNAAANRAAIAYNALLPAMEGVSTPDEEEPLAPPDLGGANHSTTPADDADDWLSGVDGDDSGDDW